MERFCVVVITLLLYSTSAFATNDERKVARYFGGLAMAEPGFPSDPCPLESNRKSPALFSVRQNVHLQRGPLPDSLNAENLAPQRSPPQIRVAESPAEFESTLWTTIKTSADPADYEAYLELFPNGRFAEQAREMLVRLRSRTTTAAPDERRGIKLPREESIERIDSTYTVRTTANLRSAPSIEAAIVGRAETGETLFVLGRPVGKNWYKVSTNTGMVAYVAAGLVSKPETRPQAPATAPRDESLPMRITPSADDRKHTPPAVDAGTDIPQAGAPTLVPSAVPDLSPTQQAPPNRRSPAEIKREWNQKIDLVKDTGPHGNCDLFVGSKWEDPPEYDACEERNDKIKLLRLQMERELAGQR